MSPYKAALEKDRDTERTARKPNGTGSAYKSTYAQPEYRQGTFDSYYRAGAPSVKPQRWQAVETAEKRHRGSDRESRKQTSSHKLRWLAIHQEEIVQQLVANELKSAESSTPTSARLEHRAAQP